MGAPRAARSSTSPPGPPPGTPRAVPAPCPRPQGESSLASLERTLAAVGDGGKLVRLPEQVFDASFLSVKHAASGAAVRFDALGALEGWRRADLPPVRVSVAEEWQASRAKDIGEGVQVVEYDWTYTTDYTGTLLQRPGSTGGQEGVAFADTATHSVDRGMLLARDPILWYDDVPLFESEMDDNGVCQCSVKARVMPRCFLVLFRFFLRVDGVVVRLRETRLFAKWDAPGAGAGAGPGGGGGGPARLVREVKWASGDGERLAACGASIGAPAFADADSAAQALAAVAPACTDLYKVQVAEL